MGRELEASKKKNNEQKKLIFSLEAKIRCKDEKIVSMEKNYNTMEKNCNDQKKLLKARNVEHAIEVGQVKKRVEALENYTMETDKIIEELTLSKEKNKRLTKGKREMQ